MTTEIELNIDQNRSPYFKISASLNGQVYELTFRWSVRWVAWYMDIDETVFGIKVVNGVNLLAPYHYNKDLPQGKLGVVRNNGTSSKPYFDNIGIEKEMTLVYEPV